MRTPSGNCILLARGDEEMDHATWAHADDGREKSPLPGMLIYAVAAGFASLAVGAVASLAAASTAGKITLWVMVSGIASIAAGLGYGFNSSGNCDLLLLVRLRVLGALHRPRYRTNLSSRKSSREH